MTEREHMIADNWACVRMLRHILSEIMADETGEEDWGVGAEEKRAVGCIVGGWFGRLAVLMRESVVPEETV